MATTFIKHYKAWGKTDFVALAYNPHWWQPDTYNWPIDFPNNWGAEDGFGATYYDYVPFNGYFQSLVVFCDKLINSRPFRVKPPNAYLVAIKKLH